jgi:hypothetical protein
MQGKDLHARKERAVASLKNSHKEKGENQIPIKVYVHGKK